MNFERLFRIHVPYLPLIRFWWVNCIDAVVSLLTELDQVGLQVL